MNQPVLTARLFFALPLPNDLQLMLAKHCQTLRVPHYRCIAADNLHITVHFLGNVQQQAIPQLIATYQPVVDQISVFNLSFRELAFAGPPQDPERMIWAVFDAHPTYKQLVTQTRHVLNQFLHEPHGTIADAHQDIIPHVTLARRENGSRYQAPLPPLRQPTVQPITVTTVELMQSQLAPGGSVYTTVHTFRLHP
jgi:2'-5' RNA ligase